MGRKPFGEVGPISFFLCFIEVGVEVDDELLKELFAQIAGLQFFGCVSSFEFPILFLSDISPNLGRHVDINI